MCKDRLFEVMTSNMLNFGMCANVCPVILPDCSRTGPRATLGLGSALAFAFNADFGNGIGVSETMTSQVSRVGRVLPLRKTACPTFKSLNPA
jgi:hypothetical protein